jgi:hypothetical protein
MEYIGVLIWRFDAPLSFTNKDYFKELLLREIAAADAESPRHVGAQPPLTPVGGTALLSSSTAHSDDQLAILELRPYSPPNYNMAELTVLPPASPSPVNESKSPLPLHRLQQPQALHRPRPPPPLDTNTPALLSASPPLPSPEPSPVCLHTLVLDCSSIVDIDDSALSMLLTFVPQLRPRLLFASLKGPVCFSSSFPSIHRVILLYSSS